MKETKEDGFFIFLKQRLQEPLPGIEAHLQMAPRLGPKEFRTFVPTKNAKPSAVLVLLAPENGDYSALLTIRSANLISHKGQISFAGGHSEEGEKPAETALREANEEVGIIPKEVFLAGDLSKLFVPPSNTIITPVVGFIRRRPHLRVNRCEVEDAFYIGLDYLSDSKNVIREMWTFGADKVEVPFWNIGRKAPLWGATAMIIAELVMLYREYNSISLTAISNETKCSEKSLTSYNTIK